MSRRGVVAANLGALVVAAIAATALSGATTLQARAPAAETGAVAPPVTDADGTAVAVRPWRRIVSTSWLADALLLELAEPDRVAAFTVASERSLRAYRFAGKPHVDGLGPLEPILTLKPDLLFVNSLSDPGRAARLRELGVEVFDLGGLHGLSSVTWAAERIGALLGDPERGRRYAATLRARMSRVAATLGDRPRRRALYVSVISTHLFGGTRGTSYHDVLTAAGLDDVAATAYEGWPEYRAETLLSLAPDVIVTKEGGGVAVCAQPGLGTLPACRTPGAVIELPEGLVEDPGPAMLDAAEMLFARAYPDLAR